MLRAKILIGLFIGFWCSEMAQAAPVRDEPKPPSETAKATAAAAQTAYEKYWALFQQENAPRRMDDVEKIYIWSRRWMEAQYELSEKKEDRLAAAEAHLERMKRLESKAKRYAEAGMGKPEDKFAVEFYRLEAQGWVPEKKKKE